jgi:outer membrane lipoprotein-sorting protein
LRKEESSFSEEKEAKRLLFLRWLGRARIFFAGEPAGHKSFLVLFFKKEQKFLLSAALLLSACTLQQHPVLSVADTSDIARAEAYLNSLHAFEAQFVQSGALGPGAGLVWLDRPGNLRIDYQGPGARLMVISGGHVRVLDRRSGALTTMALSRTPLAILLAPEIHLSGAISVVSVAHEGGDLQLTLQNTDAPSQGSLTLNFAQLPLRLRAVTVTDAYQRASTLALSGIDTHPALTPGLFAPPAGPAGT